MATPNTSSDMHKETTDSEDSDSENEDEPEGDDESEGDDELEGDELFPKPATKDLKKPFAYRRYNLVDLEPKSHEPNDKMKKVDADVDKLSEQLQKTIKSFEKKFKLEVNHYYIGKTFVNLVEHTEGYRTSSDAWKIQLKECTPKKKPGEKQSSTPPKPKYKKDEGISSRKSTHMKEHYGNVGLVVLAIVTEEVLPKKIAPSVKIQDYTLILEQRLQHKQLIEAEDKRCANVSSSEGRRVKDKANKNAYVIYMTLGCDQWEYNKITK